MRNVLLAVSGPSGVGKGTLMKLLLEEDPTLALSISCTTRAPREGEVNGREYFFLTREEFEKRIADGEFLEYDEHFGNYYGTPRSFVEKQLEDHSVILEIDVVGALNAKKVFPDAVLVMVTPPSIEELISRLEGRGSETEDAREERLNRVRYELEQSSKYDYVVINDDLQSTKNRLQEIIYQEKNK